MFLENIFSNVFNSTPVRKDYRQGENSTYELLYWLRRKFKITMDAVQEHFKWFSTGTLVGCGALKNEYKKNKGAQHEKSHS